MASDPSPDFWGQLQMLAVSGVGGAFFRAAFAPEKDWQRRIVQGLAGALSAIFLGGFAATVINNLIDTGVYSYLSAGFVMGSGGELAVKWAQDKFFGGVAKK